MSQATAAIEPMAYYRLRTPDWAVTVGQGPPPAHCAVSIDGERVEVPYGAVVQASARTTNAEATPPKVHVRFLEQIADQLEPVDAE